MTCSCIKTGDMVKFLASGHGKIVNEIIWDEYILRLGEGPHTVKGVGPKFISIDIGDKNENVPKSYVRKVK